MKLVLPPGSVSWHPVPLPRVAAHKLRAVLEGLLEDQLLQDLAQVHLAVAPKSQQTPGAPTWVAACDKAWLTRVLQQLEQAGHRVQSILPGATPQANARCWIQPGANTAWVCSAGPRGVVALPLPEQATTAHQLLPLLSAPHGTDAPINCFAPAPWLTTAQTLWPGLAWQVESPEARSQRFVDLDWDLAQFDLQLPHHSGWSGSVRAVLQRTWSEPAWRPLRWGLAGVLLVQLTALNVAAWQERHTTQRLQEQAQQVLQQTFPHVTLVLDAPVQMQREVDRLQQAHGQLGPRDLETVLQTMGKAQANWPLDELHYTQSTFSVRHPELDTASRQQVVSELAQLGWQVRGEPSANDHAFAWEERP